MYFCVIYSCDQSWIFSIITPVFSVTWSFRNILYIYAFSRRFYPKQLTLHSSFSFTFYQLLLSLGIEPMILALLAPCSTIWATGNDSWAANQYIRMISEGSCDTEDWSNDAINSALHHNNKLQFTIYYNWKQLF